MLGIFIMTIAIMPASKCYAELMIITNNSVSTNSIKKTQLKDIFLGNTVKWDENTKINIVVQKNSEAHTEFVKTIVRKSSSQFRNYWKKMLFTGKGSAPKTFDNTAALIEYISKTEGAIGYIDSDIAIDGVKVFIFKDPVKTTCEAKTVEPS